MPEKYSISIRGHKTSFTLEQEFHAELARIARSRETPLATLITRLDAQRPEGQNLSSCLRLFVLKELKREKGET